jgi:ribosomal protein S19E (S16A)
VGRPRGAHLGAGSNFDNDYIEELEEDLRAESRAAAKASAKPPKPPRVPYAVAAAAREAAPEAVRVARVRDASLLRKAIAKAAVKELRKERDGRAKRAVFCITRGNDVVCDNVPI